MQHLIVVCHPKRESFVQSIAKAYADALRMQGHTVVVRDLYRARFDPALNEADLAGADKGRVATPVRREQRYISEAGAIAFFFPLWWGYMPAMMKGYVDRVFSRGFAYDVGVDEMAPLLAGKKALVFTSSGAPMAELRRSKQWQAMGIMLKNHFLALCGIELLEHVHFASIAPGISEQTFGKHLSQVRDAADRYWGAYAVPAG